MARKNFLVSAVFNFGQITREISIAVGKTQNVDLSYSAPEGKPCQNENSDCDLNGAIAFANAMAPLPLIDNVLTPKIDFNSPSAFITGDISFRGNLKLRTILDAKTFGRHFTVGKMARLELNYLTLIGGKANVGGTVFVEAGSLFLKDSSFNQNTTSAEKDSGKGGAVYAKASRVEVADCEFTENTTSINGSLPSGGAIALEQGLQTSIRNSQFRSNKSQIGSLRITGRSLVVP